MKQRHNIDDRAGSYFVVIYDARGSEGSQKHSSLYAASKAARALNAEQRCEYCYVWGANEGQAYNPRYCRPFGERFGSPG